MMRRHPVACRPKENRRSSNKGRHVRNVHSIHEEYPSHSDRPLFTAAFAEADALLAKPRSEIFGSACARMTLDLKVIGR